MNDDHNQTEATAASGAGSELSGSVRFLYAPRGRRELGRFYTRHVQAMTVEGLHEKCDIAAELAWRDQRIAILTEVLRRNGIVHQGERWDDDSPFGPKWLLRVMS